MGFRYHRESYNSTPARTIPVPGGGVQHRCLMLFDPILYIMYKLGMKNL